MSFGVRLVALQRATEAATAVNGLTLEAETDMALQYSGGEMIILHFG